DKSGYSNAVTPSRAGFGFFHDGSIDSVTTFLSSPVFNQLNDQDIADLVALMFAFSGSDFGNPTQNPPILFFTGFSLIPLVSEPPSMQFSKDTHAAVGQQQTINTPLASLTLINQYIDLADAGAVDLVVKGSVGGDPRGWFHDSGASTGTPIFRSDSATETIDLETLVALADVGSELTFTVVHRGTGERLGVDRDGDLIFDFDELSLGSDPADPSSIPMPRLSVSTMNLSATIEEGGVTPNQSFTVRNSGGGAVQYSITDDVDWLAVIPTFGTLTGETDPIRVNFATISLPPDVYTGLITIRALGAMNSPQTILVTLTVTEEAIATTSTGGDGGGGCFIATAAYGTPLTAEIDTLRAFRDEVLLSHWVGAGFVDAYYSASPPLADYIAEHDTLRALSRGVLYPVIWLAGLSLHSPFAALLLLLSLLSVFGLGTRRLVRTR
ncbi:MAG: hypothetical protein IID08_10825, partial [Candidatus Hydrogenedentes bacterium]|nr:hypothetical protein [Candidatus Hydrogenedentota bacterium]